jgi:hypothetical protein
MARRPIQRSSGGPANNRPSVMYRIFWQAVRARKQLTCVYAGRYREIFPVIVGYAAKTQERAFVFQTGGESSQKLSPGGNWRCFDLAGVTDVGIRDGEWTSGMRHSQPQSCIEHVDVDANIPDTLARDEPLAFGSSDLRPPRRSP